jgi:putative FmdB family regulatory protein
VPVYTFDCESCGSTSDEIVSYRLRDIEPVACRSCGVGMRRRGISGFRLGKARYQMAAVLPNGDHIPGHFGKDARRRRR